MNLQDYFRSGADTRAGRKERNEDCLGISTPSREEFLSRCIVYAIADGVSNSTHGDRAAHCSVRGVLGDFYATPDTWATPVALDKVIAAQNRWLRSQREKGDDALATTLSLLVLSGNRYCIAHVGDTRIYRYRPTQQHLDCLTTDHVWKHPQMSHVLTRAMGLDNTITVDYYEGNWQAGDIFLLLCDGVWSSVKEKELLHLLYLYCSDIQNSDPVLCAKKIVDAALDAGSDDNVSALVVQCLQTAPDSLKQRLMATHNQNVPPLLKPNSVIDGFVVDEVLHESRESLVYRVHHPQHEGSWVLKTLTAQSAQDETRRSALHAEEWITARMPSRHFVEVLPLDNVQRQHLYLVQRFYTGATLARRLKQHHRYSNAEIVHLGIQLLRALGSLHRLQVIHRDIKPENLHLGSDGVLRILDLGVAWSANTSEQASQLNPGTPSYMAPELFVRDAKGNMPQASMQADIYAAGVTLYHLLAQHYPYGEVEPFQHPKFGDPVPVSRYRHDVPLWLDNILLKACARDVKDRFETAEEFLLALENGENNSLNVRRQSPLLERDPVSLWRSIALIAIVLNIFLLYLILTS